MKDKLIKYFNLFMIGSISGWIYEEIYCLIADGELVYRGSLWGPWLPIYGIGAIVIELILSKYKKHPSIIFLGSVGLTAVVEYTCGFIDDHILHRIYWDYTNKPFNLDGYVCLESVLLFGLLAILYVYVLKPIYNKLPNKVTKVLFYILLILFVVDLIVSTFIIKSPFGLV